MEEDDRRGAATGGGDAFRPAALEGMSVPAMRQYLAEMRAEIARVEAVIAARGTQRSVADGFFRQPE